MYQTSVDGLTLRTYQIIIQVHDTISGTPVQAGHVDIPRYEYLLSI